MNFRQFAFNNVRRNARAYSAYFLSSAFAVMIFFTYAVFIFHPNLVHNDIGATTKQGMKAAEYVIFAFSFLFVLYSISAFLKVRKKEFGILSILGSEGKQLNRLIFLENMIIGSASILTGLASGMILSKLFLLIGARVAEMKELPFYLPWKAMALTTICFFVLFFVISLVNLFLVRQNRVLELLQGSSKPKPEPKVSIWLSLLSVACFVGAGFLMKQNIMDKSMNFNLILLLGTVATYFFFTQISMFIIRLLKKNRRFFWRGTNLLWVSDMAYKVKDNARMFFMITMVIAMSCSAIGMILTLNAQNEQQFKSNKFAYKYNTRQMGKWKFDFKKIKKDTAKIDKELKQAGIKYKKIRKSMLEPGAKEFKENTGVMKESDYNRLADIYDLPKVPSLTSKETMIMNNLSGTKEESKKLQKLTMAKGKAEFTITKQFEKTLDNSFAYSHIAVISDISYAKLKKVMPSASEEIDISYYIPEWLNDQLPDSNSVETKIGKKLVNWSRENATQNSIDIFQSRAVDYVLLKQSMSILSFIGIFIAAIFSLSSASFLYFKLYTELDQDRHLVHSLSRMGLSSKEMKRSATIQIAALFFIPLVVAGMETLIGLFLLKEQFYLGEPLIPALMGIGSFFTVQVVYFLIVRSRYLAQLNRVMV
ncbi:putative ABC transport system permease protein [Marininema mesophilum]|uniref:Putative ABC transport system permease protein n=1 Tax=Marininema mesophilum TaxID=1048340 RepID=A0A1H2QXF6_9BACL|nr:ABC transporter permease [Marininema mesophilum]SDW11304.1 putative ABC transport system permease protein [Marininema mesophilum]